MIRQWFFFDRIGQKVLLTEPNYRIAITTTRQNDAPSTIRLRARFSGGSKSRRDAAACSLTQPPFFMRDAHGVAERLRKSEQGRYRLDEARSALFL